jgi:two-component system, sensor histidine kinase PdtaS
MNASPKKTVLLALAAAASFVGTLGGPTLKHGFPDGRAGKITVTYKEKNGCWTLRVGDDGIGMPAAPAEAVAGLGTSVVQALARQLAATVEVADAHPGVLVSVAHEADRAEPLQGAAAAV